MVIEHQFREVLILYVYLWLILAGKISTFSSSDIKAFQTSLQWLESLSLLCEIF